MESLKELIMLRKIRLSLNVRLTFLMLFLNLILLSILLALYPRTEKRLLTEIEDIQRNLQK